MIIKHWMRDVSDIIAARSQEGETLTGRMVMELLEKHCPFKRNTAYLAIQKDGGPAFPSEQINEQFVYPDQQHKGMSLRDYFAGHALNELYRSIGALGVEVIAKTAYDIADAMLKARGEE